MESQISPLFFTLFPLSGHTCSYGLLATFFFEELSSFQVPTSYQIQQWRLEKLCFANFPHQIV